MISSEKWKPSGEIILEPNADRAVRSINSLAVIAGPGAGKTELLAQRADFLLRTGWCPYPKRILALAFKKDAARNLKERVRLRCGHDFASRIDSLTFHGFAKSLLDRFIFGLPKNMTLKPDYSIDPYTKIEGSRILFDDLVPYAQAILKNNPIVLRALQESYSHVFLDEFQDCTNDQYKLIRTSFLGTTTLLTAVGDTKQRIMSWAGALEGIFIKLVNEFKAERLNLYQNFRAAPNLRRMQNVIVRHMDPGAALNDDSIQGNGGECVLLTSPNSQEEASKLALLIHGYIAEGIPKNEIVILTRLLSGAYTAELRAELSARHGIEMRDENELQDLLTEEIALLIIDFVKLLINDQEAEAWHRLSCRIESIMDDGESMEAGFRNWRELNDLITRQRQLVDARSADDTAIMVAVDDFLNLVGLGRLRGLSESYQQGDYISKIIASTRLALSQARARAGSWNQAVKGIDGHDAVRAMTIHKSKGLEFDTVVLLGLEDQAFFDFGKNPDDETSAFFVALSRAKNRIIVSACSHRARPVGVKRWEERRTNKNIKALFAMLQEAGLTPIKP